MCGENCLLIISLPPRTFQFIFLFFKIYNSKFIKVKGIWIFCSKFNLLIRNISFYNADNINIQFLHVFYNM